jgi:hypothetical protein
MRLGSFLINDLVAATAARAPDIRVVAGNLLGSVEWLLENVPRGGPPSRKSRAAMVRTKIAPLVGTALGNAPQCPRVAE